MGSFSIWHWAIVLFVVIPFWAWPVWRILRKMGYSPWWVLVSLIPVLSTIGLWVLAIKRWPVEQR